METPSNLANFETETSFHVFYHNILLNIFSIASYNSFTPETAIAVNYVTHPILRRIRLMRVQPGEHVAQDSGLFRLVEYFVKDFVVNRERFIDTAHMRVCKMRTGRVN